MNYWRENAGSRLWIWETMVLLAYLSWFLSSLKVVIGDFLRVEHSGKWSWVYFWPQSRELREREGLLFSYVHVPRCDLISRRLIASAEEPACDFSLQALRQAAPVTSVSADVVFGMLPGWTAPHWPTRLCCSATSSIMKSVSVATGCLNFYFKFQRDYKTSETFQ